MSFRAMRWVLEHSQSRLGDRLVLLAIAWHVRENALIAWPSVATLAKEAGVSIRQVRYSTKTLLKMGEITIERGAGRQGSNLYWMPGVRQSALFGANHSGGAKRSAPARVSPGEQTAPELEVLITYQGTYLRVNKKQDEILGEAFPWVDRQAEYRRMDSWLAGHPTRRPKSHAAFAHNWFAKIPPKELSRAEQRTRGNLERLGFLEDGQEVADDLRGSLPAGSH